MNLLEKVITLLDIEPAVAESCLGTLFSCVAMSVDAASFRAIKEGLPDVEYWLGKTKVGGGRTGEMLALAGPQALARNLGAAGLTEEASRKLVSLVADELEDLVPDRIRQRVRSLLPLASVE